jgi:hypothetical protein
MQAATFQENFDSGVLGPNFTAQADSGFTYGIQTNIPNDSVYHSSLYLTTQPFSVGQASVATTLGAVGDFSTTVTAYNDLNSVGVDYSAAGILGLRMVTDQGNASIFFRGGGSMGAVINFPSVTTSNFWSVPISVYDIFRLEIVRTGNTLSLSSIMTRVDNFTIY